MVGFDNNRGDSGIGQGDDAIASADVFLRTTREYGAPSQLEKLAALDFAILLSQQV